MIGVADNDAVKCIGEDVNADDSFASITESTDHTLLNLAAFANNFCPRLIGREVSGEYTDDEEKDVSHGVLLAHLLVAGEQCTTIKHFFANALNLGPSVSLPELASEEHDPLRVPAAIITSPPRIALL